MIFENKPKWEKKLTPSRNLNCKQISLPTVRMTQYLEQSPGNKLASDIVTTPTIKSITHMDACTEASTVPAVAVQCVCVCACMYECLPLNVNSMCTVLHLCVRMCFSLYWPSCLSVEWGQTDGRDVCVPGLVGVAVGWPEERHWSRTGSWLTPSPPGLVHSLTSLVWQELPNKLRASLV